MPRRTRLSTLAFVVHADYAALTHPANPAVKSGWRWYLAGEYEGSLDDWDV